MGDRIQQAQEVLDHQAHEQEMQRQELHSLEQTVVPTGDGGRILGRVNLYQEMLQPVQDCLDGLRQQLSDRKYASSRAAIW